MHFYLENVIEPYHRQTASDSKGILFMDHYGSHKKECVLEKLTDLNFDVKFIIASKSNTQTNGKYGKWTENQSGQKMATDRSRPIET